MIVGVVVTDADVQIRIARFLMEPSRGVKDRMLSEFGWTWRQTQALQDEYERNVRLSVLCFFEIHSSLMNWPNPM